MDSTLRPFVCAEGDDCLKLVLLVLLLGPLFRALGRKEAVQRWVERHSNQLRKGCLGFCVVTLVVVVGLSLAIACQDRLFLHDEATVLSTVAAFAHGQQIYPLASDRVEYGLLYGPATYLVYLPPMMFGAERFGVYLAWVGLAFAGSLALVFAAMKREYGRGTALCSAVLLVAFTCPFFPYELAIKGDIWILLFTALGLWASRLRRRWVAAVLIAVSGAMIVDLKIPLLAIALLPCVTLWVEGKQARWAALLGGVGIPVLALGPFALKHISLKGYMEQLADAAQHGFSLSLFEHNLLFALYFLLPTIGLLWTAWEQDREGYAGVASRTCGVPGFAWMLPGDYVADRIKEGCGTVAFDGSGGPPGRDRRGSLYQDMAHCRSEQRLCCESAGFTACDRCRDSR